MNIMKHSASKLLQILLLASTSVSGYKAKFISGTLHEDVILPCIVAYKETFSYDNVVVLWSYGNLGVHHFYYGKFQHDQQDQQFKGRTHLFHEEFNKGNLSLLLKNIHLSDAGTYQCRVFLQLLTEYKVRSIELVVQERSQSQHNESSEISLSIPIYIACAFAVLIVLCRRKKRSRGTEGMVLGDQSPKKKKDS